MPRRPIPLASHTDSQHSQRDSPFPRRPPPASTLHPTQLDALAASHRRNSSPATALVPPTSLDHRPLRTSTDCVATTHTPLVTPSADPDRSANTNPPTERRKSVRSDPLARSIPRTTPPSRSPGERPGYRRDTPVLRMWPADRCRRSWRLYNRTWI